MAPTQKQKEEPSFLQNAGEKATIELLEIPPIIGTGAMAWNAGSTAIDGFKAYQAYGKEGMNFGERISALWKDGYAMETSLWVLATALSLSTDLAIYRNIGKISSKPGSKVAGQALKARENRFAAMSAKLISAEEAEKSARKAAEEAVALQIRSGNTAMAESDIRTLVSGYQKKWNYYLGNEVILPNGARLSGRFGPAIPPGASFTVAQDVVLTAGTKIRDETGALVTLTSDKVFFQKGERINMPLGFNLSFDGTSAILPPIKYNGISTTSPTEIKLGSREITQKSGLKLSDSPLSVIDLPGGVQLINGRLTPASMEKVTVASASGMTDDAASKVANEIYGQYNFAMERARQRLKIEFGSSGPKALEDKDSKNRNRALEILDEELSKPGKELSGATPFTTSILRRQQAPEKAEPDKAEKLKSGIAELENQIKGLEDKHKGLLRFGPERKENKNLIAQGKRELNNLKIQLKAEQAADFISAQNRSTNRMFHGLVGGSLKPLKITVHKPEFWQQPEVVKKFYPATIGLNRKRIELAGREGAKGVIPRQISYGTAQIPTAAVETGLIGVRALFAGGWSLGQTSFAKGAVAFAKGYVSKPFTSEGIIPALEGVAIRKVINPNPDHLSLATERKREAAAKPLSDWISANETELKGGSFVLGDGTTIGSMLGNQEDREEAIKLLKQNHPTSKYASIEKFRVDVLEAVQMVQRKKDKNKTAPTIQPASTESDTLKKLQETNNKHTQQ